MNDKPPLQPLVMGESHQHRFDHLLAEAKNPLRSDHAAENLARARELIDTLYVSLLLDEDMWKAHIAQVLAAKLVVSAAEMQPTPVVLIA